MTPGPSSQLPAGDSSEQRQAEALVLRELGRRLGVKLAPRKVAPPSGGPPFVLDGAADGFLVEIYAHVGLMKPAQPQKVMHDAYKLRCAERWLGVKARKLLVFVDEIAAAAFCGTSWKAAALADDDIEVMVIELPAPVREAVIAAQKRQFR